MFFKVLEKIVFLIESFESFESFEWERNVVNLQNYFLKDDINFVHFGSSSDAEF